ncbi:branched-chain alpha-keto acid dehydrogenase subunit E2 [Micractinium conductrix]|uniref:Dihydrolipoamide acetyltransferase component of pyruvate dehydrogenase complex n=1 Tax=Micractinium conductrix TaxID=554055 RepID=A0A2P6VMK5_9CHLO|nr:branched-chain alpha-keto acid dehydrogenase subunit E2 [Micractinium conductrix]|eukprot:PSC75275.1 branched-chain alpha-keto acid dehydrogenase subunit E2 [Micractinium conductrix]
MRLTAPWAAAVALLLLGCAAADLDGPERSGEKTLNTSSIKLVLNASQPKMTAVGLTTLCPDGASTGCDREFLMSRIADVYEVDPAGQRVANRSAADVLDLSLGGWLVLPTVDLSAVTAPPLTSVPMARYTAPFKAQLPACAGEPAGPAFLADREIQYKVVLFPNDTVYTPGVGLEEVEVLAGNVKSTVDISGWPFCNASNSLVLELALKSTQLGAPKARAPRVRTGEEVEEAAQELADAVFESIGADWDGTSGYEGDGEEEGDDSNTDVQAQSLRTWALKQGGQGNGGNGKQGGSASAPSPAPQDELPKVSRKKAVEQAKEKLSKALERAGQEARKAIEEKVAKSRPVSGLGRPSHADRLVVSLPGMGQLDAQIDVPAVALIDNIATNITVEAPAFNQGQGVQRLLLTFPSFSTLSYDPTTAFATSDQVVDEKLGEAVGATSGVVGDGAPQRSDQAPRAAQQHGSACRKHARLRVIGAPAGAAIGRVAAPRRVRVPPSCAVKEVFMPALSSTMTEGKIVSWLKAPGDKVKKGESIVVVESDKADMDVESFAEGILGSIVVPEGGVAGVGNAIAFIAETEADLEAAKAKVGGGAAPAPAAAAPAPAAEAPAAPAPAEPAPAPAAPAPAPAAPAPAPVAAAPQPRADGRVIATPYAKKLAKEMGVDLATIAGSGPAGRVTAADVEAAKARGGAPAPAAAAASAAATAAVAAPAAAAAPTPAKAAPVKTAVSDLKGTTVPLSTLQRAVTNNMMESLKVPEFRVSMAIGTDKLDALYRKLKPKGVTMTALLAKACGVALEQHPLLYASCTPDASGVTYAEHINIAMAVAMPDGGLITPVLKDADATDIYTLSRNWADLVKRARGKQLSPDEYTTGTFTISNLGMFGVESFDAILPPGQAAILAVGGSKPVVTVDENGRIGVEKQMNLNITCDHRIVYGAHAAEFLLTLKSVIENPDQLVF